MICEEEFIHSPKKKSKVGDIRNLHIEIVHLSEATIDEDQITEIPSGGELFVAVAEENSIGHHSDILGQSACAVSSKSNDQERVVLLSVVDWSGEERAKLAVRGSDSVLDGQLQIAQQTGVKTSAQRLVLGEVELKDSMTWGSIPGWRDGSTVQLTVVDDIVFDAETDRAALEVLWLVLNWRPDRPVSEGRYMRVNEEGRITKLDLFGKKLVGTIPPEIGNLTALSFLSLGDNRLTGEIPREVGNLTALTGLYLHANELTGSIPREIGNLTALQTLLIHRNKLSGHIPEECRQLIACTSFLAGMNQLTGSIPRWFGNLTQLRSLCLSSNLLTGCIPPELGNLTQLRELSLSSNSLTGMIPSELSNLTGLTGLDLQSNRLLNGPDHRLTGNVDFIARRTRARKDLSFFLWGLRETQSLSSPSILGSSASSIVPRKKRKAESIPRSGDA